MLAPPAPLQLTHKHIEDPKEIQESSDANLKLREPTVDEVREALVTNLSMIVNQTSPAQVAQKQFGLGGSVNPQDVVHTINGMVVHPHLNKQLSELNSILVYNIAALSYQLQNYGQALLYLKLLVENLEQVEEFIQVKSLFLMLQVLFELKMKYAAMPIIDLLEVKLCEIEKLIEKKK